jgi:hypothetical protein
MDIHLKTVIDGFECEFLIENRRPSPVVLSNGEFCGSLRYALCHGKIVDSGTYHSLPISEETLNRIRDWASLNGAGC